MHTQTIRAYVEVAPDEFVTVEKACRDPRLRSAALAQLEVRLRELVDEQTLLQATADHLRHGDAP